MSACTAAGTANIDVGSVRVGCKYHASCTVDYALVGICGYVVKDFVDGVKSGCSRRCFLGADFTEYCQHFVVYILCIIEEGNDNFLDAADSEFI